MTGALAALLRDAPAATAREQAARAFGRRWRAEPAWARCAALLDAAADADAALVAAAPLIEDLAWLYEGAAELVRLARADPLFEPPLQPYRSDGRAGLTLHRHARLTLSVVILPPPSDTPGSVIGFDGRAARIRVVSGEATVARFRAGHDRCIPLAPLAITTGSIFDSPAYAAWSLDAAAGDTILLVATALTGEAPPLRSFSGTTLALVSERSTDRAALRLQLIATLLRRLGHREAAPALAEAALEAPPALRWHLARELTALDPPAARPLLARLAAADPHPEVRAVAQATLALIAA